MAISLGNRAKMSTSTTGTGTISLGSAVSGNQSFDAAGITNGQTIRYAIEDGSAFEIGSGTYTSSGTTLTRSVTESSNSDNAINLSGSAEVFITATVADLYINDGASNLTTTGVIKGGTVEATSDTAAGDNAAMGFTSAEGLILTGQGSTNDVTIKNDADAIAMRIPTGTTGVTFASTIAVNNVDIATGAISLKNSGAQSYIRFYCESNNAHYAQLQAPAHGLFSGNVTLTLPATTDTVAGIAATQTFTNKTLTSPKINENVTVTTTATEINQLDAITRGSILYGNASGATARLAKGGANTVLTSDGTDLSWASASGGGADLYAANESSPAAQPSATGTNAVALGDSAVSTGTDSFALGKARAAGSQSFAAHINNNTTSYGTSDSYSVAIGNLSKASGGKSFCFSNTATASGSNSGVFSGSSGTASGSNSIVLGGDGCVADANFSSAKGSAGNANGVKGKHSTGQGQQIQGAHYVLAYLTTNATPIALNTDRYTPLAVNQITLQNNTAITFSGTVIARRKASEGTDVGSWEIAGMIRREANAGTTVLVTSNITTHANPSGWSIVLSADTSLGCLKVQATGAASNSIKWAASIRTAEATYA